MTTSEDDEKPLTESEIRRSLSGKMSREKIDRYIEMHRAKNKRDTIINPLQTG